MDWETLEIGLRAWFAVVANIATSDVVFESQPQGYRDFPQADLQLNRSSSERGTDEVRRQTDAQGRLIEYVVGNRTAVFTATVRSRDLHGEMRADAVLDRVRTKVWLEFSNTAFEALDVSPREVSQVQPAREVVEQRELSVASISITLAYTVCEVNDLSPPVEPIETVILGGTVDPIGTVEDQVIE